MTASRRDATIDNPQGGDTPASAWIRNQKPILDSKLGYDLEDIDGMSSRWIWHHYLKGYIRLLEFKEHMAPRSFPQEDTQSVIDQMLRFASSHPDCKVKRKNSTRPTEIKYFGYPLIQFEQTNPNDGKIYIDGRLVTKDQYLRFLKFEWTPDTRLQPQVIQCVPSSQDFHDQVFSSLQDMLNGCLVDGTLQDALDDIKDLVLRYDGLLHNRRSRRARKLDEIMRSRGQLELFQGQSA